MDEKKNTDRTVEVVDTSDQPAEAGQVVKEAVAEHEAQTNSENTKQNELAPLFADNTAENFRTRWLAIQSKFVDDPKATVQEADNLVTDVIQGITSSFADRRDSLEKNWNGGGEASTEELRVALKQYRSFFERLLSLQS